MLPELLKFQLKAETRCSRGLRRQGQVRDSLPTLEKTGCIAAACVAAFLSSHPRPEVTDLPHPPPSWVWGFFGRKEEAST